jgi:hypothetical protein
LQFRPHAFEFTLQKTQSLAGGLQIADIDNKGFARNGLAGEFTAHVKLIEAMKDRYGRARRCARGIEEKDQGPGI